MAEILGVGCTHRPLMLRPNEDWTFMIRAALDDPAMPEAMKNPATWPAPVREELGNDWGASAAARGREVYRAHFAEARRAIDEFNPDVVIMWGDDQYENFKEDIVPPFAVLAYDDQEIQPWAHRRSPVEPVGRAEGQDDAGARPSRGRQISRSGLIEAGIDVGYSYKPLHHPMGHAFENTVILLDDERRGFDYPVVQFSVNCYGRRVNAARGLRLPLAMGRDPQRRSLRSAGPQPASLHAGRRRRGAGHGRQPVAGRVCRVVLLVAFVSDREELAALARCRGRPPALRRARDRRLRRLASLHDRPDRGIRAARGAELVLPAWARWRSSAGSPTRPALSRAGPSSRRSSSRITARKISIGVRESRDPPATG